MKRRRSGVLGMMSGLDQNMLNTPPIISRMGGRLRRYDTGGNRIDKYNPQTFWAQEYEHPSDAPNFSDNPKYSSPLENTTWGNTARREIFGENSKAEVNIFPKPTVSSALSDTPTFKSRKLYTDFQEASKPDNTSSTGSGTNWGEVAKDAVPFISNIANSFRKLPAPYQPVQESYFRSPKANLSASRNSIDRYLRTTQQGNRLGLGNKQVAAANSADAMGKAIEGNNQVNQQETQLQNQADLQTNYVNSMVGARNTGRSNDYLQSILNQKLAQQQLQYDNLADAGEKYGLQRRDKTQMRMEDRKLDILSRFYKDTGIYNRNVKDLAGKERYSSSRFGGPTGGNSIAYITYKGGGNWIQKAVNPAHKGYCTPMTKSTCTGRRRALAMTFKKHHGFH